MEWCWGEVQSVVDGWIGIIFKSKNSYRWMKKQAKQNEQIARIIEREQVISYKRKGGTKFRQSDDEIESANSLKSGVFSEDSLNVRLFQDAKLHKKNTPLPELYREKRRIFYRNLQNSEHRQPPNYLEKEVRQHDNLVLKQKNNHLTAENMKLKTRITNLEKVLSKASKGAEEDGPRPQGILLPNPRMRGPELLSLKLTVKNLRRELDDQKKENEKIKFSVKFSRISELECEREEILAETSRLRQMLDEELAKRASQRVKEQGLTGIEQKYQSLTDKNVFLAKENSELKARLRSLEQASRRFKTSSQNEKNLSKMLFNAKRLIKEKEREIETLKTASCEPKVESGCNNNSSVSEKEVGRPYEALRANKSPEKRVMSKSAQKYRKKQNEEGGEHLECKNCAKYKSRITLLEKKIEELTASLKREKENNTKMGSLGEFSRDQIDLPTPQELTKLSRFLVFRFQAHHLGCDEAHKYLINGEVNEDTKKEQISVGEVAESLVAEPFSLLSNRYLDVCLMKLFYPAEVEKNSKGSLKMRMEESKKLTKGEIIGNFVKVLESYEIMSQEKEEEMFIQIAELVTNYHQHILTALNRKKNGEGTISEQELINFFNEIELEKQFVDFIICQIILESLDLEHLNFYTIFQIFYMPAQVQSTGPVEPNQPNKKKFQVDHSQVVKEEDEEYEESKSHLDPKKRGQSRRDDEELNDEDFNVHPSLSENSEEPAEQGLGGSKKDVRTKKNKSMNNMEGKFDKERMSLQIKDDHRKPRNDKANLNPAKLKNKANDHVEDNEKYENEEYDELIDEDKNDQKGDDSKQAKMEKKKLAAKEEEVEEEYKDEFN